MIRWIKWAGVSLFIGTGWVFFLWAMLLPALGLRDDIRALRCDMIAYAESRGADLTGVKRCEE